MSAPQRIWMFSDALKPYLPGGGKIMMGDTEYIRADLVQALADALRDLMAIVEDARADEDVDAMDAGGAWLCCDEMHCRMGAARAALIAIEGG